MKALLILPALLMITAIQAQNLVPNPGFENNNACPNQINQVNKADGWDGWGVTPDYYHSCANISAPNFGVPSNNRGFQVPHSGQAYVGLFTFTDLTPNFREFIGRALSQPLMPGQQYFVSFWVCAAEQLLGSHTSDRIGIRFTTVPHSMFDPDTALNNGHVFATSVISDSVNWTLVSGTFIADSAYTHFGIGNYFDDANTTLVTGHPTSNYAYYLIDDICVSVDSAFCTFETALSEFASDVISISPNPASDYFMITGELPQSEGHVIITDISGRIVKKLKMPAGVREVSTSGIPAGMYYVMVSTSGLRMTCPLTIVLRQ